MHGAGHTTGSHATNYPATDKAWTLAGAGYSADPEVMAAHVKSLYQELEGSAYAVVTKLYETHRPELLDRESGAKPGSPLADWLHMIRHCITAWVVSTCGRPRDRFGYIMKDLPTKGEIIADVFYSHLNAVDESDEYKQLKTVTRTFEDIELGLGDLAHRAGPERRVRSDIASLGEDLKATVHAASSSATVCASSTVAAAANEVTNAVIDAASVGCEVQRCRKCKARPFVQQLMHACRRPEEADPVGWSPNDKMHGCACRSALASDNARCKELTDKLLCGDDGDSFLFAYSAWDGAAEHLECVDQLGTSWLHLAVGEGLLHVVRFLLDEGATSVLEAIDARRGKPISYAMELRSNQFSSRVDMLSLLLEYGADSVSACTQSARYFLGRTPEYLARHYGASEAEELLKLLRSYAKPAPGRMGLPARDTQSSWRPIMQRFPLSTSPAPSALTVSSVTASTPLATASTSTSTDLINPITSTSTALTVADSSTSASESDLRQQLALRQAQLDAYSGSTASVPQSIPLETQQLTDVPHMMRQWRAIIAPQESKGQHWRSKDKLGKELQRSVELRLSSKYYPVGFAVMQRVLDQQMSHADAEAEVQRLKLAHGGWSAFINSLPKPDSEAKKRYKAALLALQPVPQKIVSPPRTSPELASPVAPSTVPAIVASAANLSVVDGALRYLAFDPSLSCGWAILQVKAEQLVVIDCGVIQVNGTDDFARCNDLKRQMDPLFTPPPHCVFMESFVGNGRTTDAISYYIRAAIGMEIHSRGLTLEEIAPQSWKNAIGIGGRETDKAVIKSKLEATLGVSFPSKIPNANSGRSVSFKHDASDACGIGLACVQKRHSSLSVASPLEMSAPAIAEQQSLEGGKSKRARK